MRLIIARSGDSFTIEQHLGGEQTIELTRNELEWLQARIARMLTDPEVTRCTTTRPRP